MSLYGRQSAISHASSYDDGEILDIAQSSDQRDDKCNDESTQANVIDLQDDDSENNNTNDHNNAIRDKQKSNIQHPNGGVSSSSSSDQLKKRPLQASSSAVGSNNNTKKRKGQGESSNQVLPTVFIPLICPTPKSLTWTNIAYNVRCEDEPVLRYVPYFGDDDVTGVDVSAYDLVPGELEVGALLLQITIKTYNKHTYV